MELPAGSSVSGRLAVNRPGTLVRLPHSDGRADRADIHLNDGGVLQKHQRTDFDVARDELMSHIHRCGVLKASTEQQEQWLDDTMQYMGERYTGLSEGELKELHEIGRRFCQPVIAHGPDSTALDAGGQMEEDASGGSEQGEMAGAA
jgi:hypothetical protein